MNRYMCSFCGETFDEPHIDRARENLDGENGIWDYDVKTCPLCGSDNIEDGVQPCQCGNPMRDGEIVCAKCRQKFLFRLNAFIDECTAEEVELLDRVIDGNSFADAKKWR